MAQGTGWLINARFFDRCFDGPLEKRLMKMMPVHNARAGIDRKAWSRKAPEPVQGNGGIGIFAAERIGHAKSMIVEIPLKEAAALGELGFKGIDGRVVGDAILGAFAIAHKSGGSQNRSP
ncbi:MAG: hypothetical protein JWL59_4886 [Chthoniobacteraceae bacterium]|nr:hypothetical protein [Chthoniobacteraceae bacterium]